MRGKAAIPVVEGIVDRRKAHQSAGLLAGLHQSVGPGQGLVSLEDLETPVERVVDRHVVKHVVEKQEARKVEDVQWC